MVRHENEKGSVNVSTNVYTDIVGTAATNCFGVKGMLLLRLRDILKPTFGRTNPETKEKTPNLLLIRQNFA